MILRKGLNLSKEVILDTKVTKKNSYESINSTIEPFSIT